MNASGVASKAGLKLTAAQMNSEFSKNKAIETSSKSSHNVLIHIPLLTNNIAANRN